jgi:hypothetical protein
MEISTVNGTSTLRFDEPGKPITAALPYGETPWVRITAAGTDDGSPGVQFGITDFTVTQQYYPVVNSAFWVMNRFWGHDTFGYHIVNILLHAGSAWIVAGILRRWSVPGAVVAAVIFALHPVHVESVAWITELKNTLSGVFYLIAFAAYLRFDDTRRAP